MRITCIVPTTKITGGVRVVLTHANFLMSRGHGVIIIHALKLRPDDNPWGVRAKRLWHQARAWLGHDHVRWMPLRANLRRVTEVNEHTTPDADIVIATANETADLITPLSPKKGKKVYFIQGYETWTRKREEVEATYRLPFLRVTTSRWLAARLRERLGVAATPVGNGVDTAWFTPFGLKPPNIPLKILMPIHPLPSKGSSDGFHALMRLRGEGIPFVATFITTEALTAPLAPALALGTVFVQPSQQKLRTLYQTHDIFLHPAREEGWGLMPMEAMACRMAVVATNVGGVPEYAHDYKDARIVPPGDIPILTERLRELIVDGTFRTRIASEAVTAMRAWEWESVSRRFESLLMSALNEESFSRL
ncbi:MAG: glycosyltransferase family 4 protein [Parcubacteria group bacterium]|nr:glycosyltransferase family 4 protein [Parcubacteria group bacterium]